LTHPSAKPKSAARFSTKHFQIMATAQVILKEKIAGTNRAKREAEELVVAQEVATKIAKLKPSFTLSTGQGGKAFGSVTNMDIHKELEAAGITVDRHAIQLDKPIKKSGKTVVDIKLNAQVTAQLTITVDAGDVKDED